MAIMDIQVSPRRKGTVSVSHAVAETHVIIQQSGFKHTLHPMGTCIEGEPGQLYDLAARIHDNLAKLGYERIGVILKVDERLDKTQTMEDKLHRVESLLER